MKKEKVHQRINRKKKSSSSESALSGQDFVYRQIGLDSGFSQELSLFRKPAVAQDVPSVSPQFESKLSEAETGGESLSAEHRKPAEEALGQDLSSVKVHTSGQADQLSSSISARAFTHGSHIFFKKGEYDPESQSGQHLLAHELTHVAQQQEGRVSPKLLQRTEDYQTPRNIIDPRIKLDMPMSEHLGQVDLAAYYETIDKVNSRISELLADEKKGQSGDGLPSIGGTPSMEYSKMLDSSSTFEKSEGISGLLGLGEPGWKILVYSLNTEDTILKILLDSYLKSELETNPEFLDYLQELVVHAPGLLGMNAASFLIGQDHQAYIDRDAYTARLIADLEMARLIAEELPVPEEKIRDRIDEFSEHINLAIKVLQDKDRTWTEVQLIARDVTIFYSNLSICQRIFQFTSMFSEIKKDDLQNQSLYQAVFNTNIALSFWLLAGFHYLDGPLGLSSYMSETARKKILEEAEQSARKIASATAYDAMINLWKAERGLYKTEEAIQDIEPDEEVEFLKTVRKAAGKINAYQKLLPQMAQLAVDKPMLYFELWSTLLDEIGDIIGELSAINFALTNFSLVELIDDSWQLWRKWGEEAQGHRKVLQRYLEEAREIIDNNLDDPSKMGEAIEKLREKEDYKASLEWAQQYADDEAVTREIIILIVEVILTLVSIYVGGWLGRAVGAGLRMFAATSRIGAAIVSQSLIRGGIVLGAETLGFVLTDKLLHQLLFGEGHWDTFLEDYIKAFIMFGALKGAGRMYESLVRPGGGAMTLGQSVGMFGVELTTLQVVNMAITGWDNLFLEPDEQKEYFSWSQLGHSALFLLLLKGGMLAVRKFPTPMLRYLERSSVEMVEARSIKLQAQFDALKGKEFGVKDQQGLAREIKNIMRIRADIYEAALKRGAFDKEPDTKARVEQLIEVIRSKIEEMDKIGDLSRFGIRMGEADNLYYFKGDPDSLAEVLKRNVSMELDPRFEKAKTPTNSEVYVFKVNGQAPTFFMRTAGTRGFYTSPSETAKARGLTWKQAKEGFWQGVESKGFRVDEAFIGDAEVNLKIQEMLEKGWMPGEEVEPGIDLWLRELYQGRKVEYLREQLGKGFEEVQGLEIMAESMDLKPLKEMVETLKGNEGLSMVEQLNLVSEHVKDLTKTKVLEVQPDYMRLQNIEAGESFHFIYKAPIIGKHSSRVLSEAGMFEVAAKLNDIISGLGKRRGQRFKEQLESVDDPAVFERLTELKAQKDLTLPVEVLLEMSLMSIERGYSTRETVDHYWGSIELGRIEKSLTNNLDIESAREDSNTQKYLELWTKYAEYKENLDDAPSPVRLRAEALREQVEIALRIEQVHSEITEYRDALLDAKKPTKPGRKEKYVIGSKRKRARLEEAISVQKTIAIGQGEVGVGEKVYGGDFISVSGSNADLLMEFSESMVETPKSKDRVFDPLPPDPQGRDPKNDAELKVFEQYARNIGELLDMSPRQLRKLRLEGGSLPQVTGKIEYEITQKECPSCSQVMETQWRQLFPNVDLIAHPAVEKIFE